MSYSLSIGACENKLVISPLPLKPSVIEVKFLPTAIIKNTKTAIAINTHNNLSNKVLSVDFLDFSTSNCVSKKNSFS